MSGCLTTTPKFSDLKQHTFIKPQFLWVRNPDTAYLHLLFQDVLQSCNHNVSQTWDFSSESSDGQRSASKLTNVVVGRMQYIEFTLASVSCWLLVGSCFWFFGKWPFPIWPFHQWVQTEKTIESAQKTKSQPLITQTQKWHPLNTVTYPWLEKSYSWERNKQGHQYQEAGIIIIIMVHTWSSCCEN